jgi:putative glutamine amidotransferase
MAGGLPVLIAPGLDAASIQQLASMLDGLLLPGGVDVDPKRYGEDPHPTTNVNADLDTLEFDLLAAVTQRDLPVLAICRGCQVLNVAHGGTLWQDVPSQLPSRLIHPQRGVSRDHEAHALQLEPGSTLTTILGTSDLPVNSFHHQAVHEPGRGLAVVGHAPDGIVEAIEASDPASPFRIGIQCHPEGMVESHPVWQQLFRAFVHAAGQRRGH